MGNKKSEKIPAAAVDLLWLTAVVPQRAHAPGGRSTCLPRWDGGSTDRTDRPTGGPAGRTDSKPGSGNTSRQAGRQAGGHRG